METGYGYVSPETINLIVAGSIIPTCREILWGLKVVRRNHFCLFCWRRLRGRWGTFFFSVQIHDEVFSYFERCFWINDVSNMRKIFYVLIFCGKAESERGKNRIFVQNNQLVHYRVRFCQTESEVIYTRNALLYFLCVYVTQI